jgi:hypothetical protein
MSKIADCKADVEYRGPHAKDLRAFAAPGSWTKEKSEAFAELVEGLTKSGYRSFSSSVSTIGLQRKGQSAIYRVPAGQRGALSAYADKYVHVVCVDRTDNYSGRLFSFSEVSATGQVVLAEQEEDE